MTSSKQSFLLVLKGGTLWSLEGGTVVKDWPQKGLIGPSRNTTWVKNLADYLLEVHIKRKLKRNKRLHQTTHYTEPLISAELKYMLHLHSPVYPAYIMIYVVSSGIKSLSRGHGSSGSQTVHSNSAFLQDISNVQCSGQIKPHQREKGVFEGTNRVFFQWAEKDKTHDTQRLLHPNKNLKKKRGKNSRTRHPGKSNEVLRMTLIFASVRQLDMYDFIWKARIRWYIPPTLFKESGSMRSGRKASLVKFLQEETKVPNLNVSDLP